MPKKIRKRKSKKVLNEKHEIYLIGRPAEYIIGEPIKTNDHKLRHIKQENVWDNFSETELIEKRKKQQQ